MQLPRQARTANLFNQYSVSAVAGVRLAAGGSGHQEEPTAHERALGRQGHLWEDGLCDGTLAICARKAEVFPSTDGPLGPSFFSSDIRYLKLPFYKSTRGLSVSFVLCSFVCPVVS